MTRRPTNSKKDWRSSQAKPAPRQAAAAIRPIRSRRSCSRVNSRRRRPSSRDDPQEPTPGAAMELIRLENIYKTYHLGEVDVPVLRGISLKIHRGGLVALMGASWRGRP